MSTKTSSSSSSLLLIILLILTFPIWIGIAGGIFGLIAGLVGACIGIIAAIFGAIAGAIGSIVGIFDWFTFPHLTISAFKFFVIVAIIFAVVMMSRSKRK